MFDIGFLELLVITVLGLLVIGPERLPDAIKSGARAIGKLKQMAGQAKTEIEQQIGMDEIRQDLRNEQVLKSLQQLRDLKKQTEQKLLDEMDEPHNPEHDDYYDHGDEDPHHEQHEQEPEQEQEQEKKTPLANHSSDEKPQP